MHASYRLSDEFSVALKLYGEFRRNLSPTVA